MNFRHATLKRARTTAAALTLSVDRGAPEPLHLQITAQVRALILSRRAAPGARLPSSRTLAADLGAARSTVVLAFDQLAAEGYVETRRGSGAFVSRQLPNAAPHKRPSRERVLSSIAASGGRAAAWRPFQIDAADASLFPCVAWARLLQRSWRDHGARMLDAPDAFGWPPLRAAVSRHLREWRGLRCESEQVLVTSGVAEAIETIANVAFRPGESLFVEDPGYPAVASTLSRSGVKTIPVSIGAVGFDLAAALRRGGAGRVRGAFVAPSRHFPLGVTMPIASRLALLEWAERVGGQVVEDDYDSEYRYSGAPLPSLFGLDAGGRAIYVGSFSKVLSRSLRLGFVVLPERLVGPARDRMARRAGAASIVAQPALAEFIAGGDYAAHIRRTRRIYARRRDALTTASRAWGDLLALEPCHAGLHAVARFGPALAHLDCDRQAAAACLEAGVIATPLSRYCARRPGQIGLLLGFAAFSEDRLDDAARKLGRALATLRR